MKQLDKDKHRQKYKVRYLFHPVAICLFLFINPNGISITISIKEFLSLERPMEILVHFKEKTNLLFQILIYLIYSYQKEYML